MSYQAVLWPKWLSNGWIILAKGQLDHSNTFWSMPVWTFGPLYLIFVHPLGFFCNFMVTILSSNFNKKLAAFSKRKLSQKKGKYLVKIHIFWEGHKNVHNRPWFWNLLSKRQNHKDDCANFCGLLIKAELYLLTTKLSRWQKWYLLPKLIFELTNLKFKYWRDSMYLVKVQLLWEGHKNLRNLPPGFDIN